MENKDLHEMYEKLMEMGATKEDIIALYKIALETLEQEPSGDLISREETLTAFADYVGSGMSMNDYDALWNIVTKMPSVKQEPKTGHWIDGHCSECGCDVPAYIIDWKWQKDMDAKFCPNCGIRMESIVKEV